MNTKEVIVLVWDDPANFNTVETQRSFGNGNVFKDIIQFYSLKEFEEKAKNLSETDNLVFACHIRVEDLSLYEEFIHSGIQDSFNIPIVYYLSSDPENAPEKFRKKFGELEKVMYYHSFIRKIKSDEIKPFNKSILTQQLLPLNVQDATLNVSALPKCDYVVITALEEDEMETVLPLFIKEGRFDDDKKLIEYGYLSSNKNKKIAYASQPLTGMVDASILATEMMIRFKPKFLIMAGVLGGKPGEVNIGDVLISNKVFTIDKGKLTDEELKREIESCDLSSSYIQSFIREKKKIERYIEDLDVTRNKKPKLFFGPIACVRQVINKKEFFGDTVLTTERKAIGLEMESYGIARACEIVNNGQTIPLIIKSAMDNTFDKVDDAKKYAAWTSATFVRYILENNLI